MEHHNREREGVRAKTPGIGNGTGTGKKANSHGRRKRRTDRTNTAPIPRNKSSRTTAPAGPTTFQGNELPLTHNRRSAPTTRRGDSQDTRPPCWPGGPARAQHRPPEPHPPRLVMQTCQRPTLAHITPPHRLRGVHPHGCGHGEQRTARASATARQPPGETPTTLP